MYASESAEKFHICARWAVIRSGMAVNAPHYRMIYREHVEPEECTGHSRYGARQEDELVNEISIFPQESAKLSRIGIPRDL